MKITSPVFKDGEKIPKDYTRDGADKSPPLHIEEVPEQAKSLALIMEDPDAPSGTFNHWLLFNMDPKIHDIREDHCIRTIYITAGDAGHNQFYWLSRERGFDRLRSSGGHVQPQLRRAATRADGNRHVVDFAGQFAMLPQRAVHDAAVQIDHFFLTQVHRRGGVQNSQGR